MRDRPFFRSLTVEDSLIPPRSSRTNRNRERKNHQTMNHPTNKYNCSNNYITDSLVFEKLAELRQVLMNNYSYTRHVQHNIFIEQFHLKFLTVLERTIKNCQNIL